MSDTNTTNIAKELELITALGKFAEEHDKECTETKDHADGCPHSTCFENRYRLVASLMLETGLELSDIGFIAEALIELECNAVMEPEAATPETDILDAKELNL